MRSQRVLGAVLGVLLAALPFTLDAGAATPVTSVGTATKYGLTKGFQLLDHESFGGRGMNSPIAVAGPCVYVGDRGDKGGIEIVDASRPTDLKRVGRIAPTSGATQREIRADRGLGILVVMSYSTQGIGATSGNNLKTYDIRDCRHPRLLSTVDFSVRAPHEFFLWKDPKRPGRALAYVTFTLFTPDLMVYDLTDPTKPALASVYDLGIDQTEKVQDAAVSGSGYLHSLSVSDDGKRAYMGNWDWGFYVADTSLLADPLPGGIGLVRPVGVGKIDYDRNVHGGVKVPGKPYVVIVQEEYANAGHGCPFGWLRMGSIENEGAPTQLGQFKLPENDCDRSKKLNGTFTAHNQTVFPDVALVPWYSGGLRAVDISNPIKPVESGAFVPSQPAEEPKRRDQRLYFPGSDKDPFTGAMWSYPVVQDGVIYVVDIDQGLFALRYTGKYANEVSAGRFVEGNSAPSRYSAKAPVIRRPASSFVGWDAAALKPATVRPALGAPKVRNNGKLYGFLCIGTT